LWTPAWLWLLLGGQGPKNKLCLFVMMTGPRSVVVYLVSGQLVGWSLPSQGGWWSAVSGSCQLHPMLVSHGCMVRALKAKSRFCACCHDDSAEGQLWATPLVVSWSPRSHLMVGWSVPSHPRSVSGSQLVAGWSAPSHRWPVVGSQLVVKALAQCVLVIGLQSDRPPTS
jgi:hypothetical protein